MLTKLTICNFKRFGKVEIELGSPVVFIGPNNSGKTSAMQALALWDIGLKRLLAGHTRKVRIGVGIGVRGCCIGTTVRGGRSREASGCDEPSH